MDNEENDLLSAAAVHKFVNTFFEKFDSYEMQELLAHTNCHWHLAQEDFRLSMQTPLGLISNMVGIPPNISQYLFLLPEEEGIEPLDFRELHQIVRELMVGIYVCNQLPTISLEANYDRSTACQLPPAYIDTRVGQILVNIDYMMKALWHGVYFPKEKRVKFSEKWKKNLDVNSQGVPETKKPHITEFTTAGMLDITVDRDYGSVYDSLPEVQMGDVEMMEERRFFMQHVNDLLMQMTAYQKNIYQHESMFLIDADWSVSSTVKMADEKIDKDTFLRLKARLRPQQIVIKEHLANKAEIKRTLLLLKFISFMVPFLCAMKKRWKIPDISKLLPPMTADECKTERELPPLILNNDYKCKNFHFNNVYFHLHGGIQIDYETTDPAPPPDEIKGMFAELLEETARTNKKIMDPDVPVQDSYPVPVKEFGGVKYYVFSLEFETGLRPKWVQMMLDEIDKLKPKRLPMNDVHCHEAFKKFFGVRKAMKYKPPQIGLKEAARRGLVGVFHGLLRKCPATRLSKHDELGYYLPHHAAMYNRPHVLGHMIIHNLDLTVKRSEQFASVDPSRDLLHSQRRDVAYSLLQLVALEYDERVVAETGPTPLHIAARCGSLDSAACLMSMPSSNPVVSDAAGWAPIHHAAYFDSEPVVKLLIRRQDLLLELKTKTEQATPLLLAASSGALDCVKCLIGLGAKITEEDKDGNNLVHLAALRLHTHVLEFLINWNHQDVQVWGLLVGMLKDDDMKKKESAVQCLEVLSTSNDENWMAILDAEGVPALVNLLTIEKRKLQSVAASTLCNISVHDDVRHALTKAKAGPILIKLLSSPEDDIQSRAAIVLSDLACVDDNQNAIADQNGIPPLVTLLDSELEDVLVNAVNAIRVLCTDNPSNQSAFAENNCIEPLVEFLTVNSDILQAASSAAIAALVRGHRDNQDAVCSEGAVKPLVNLIQGRNVTVQVKAAMALEALAENNPDCQRAFLDLDAPKALIKLLKIWSHSVKEQGAVALWALAGHTKPQQKYIAEKIGVHLLIDMLLLKSERLQFVGCQAIMALTRENMDNQTKMCNEGGVTQLVRLLRQGKLSDRVLMNVIQTLGTLCVGVAHRNNKVVQKKIAEEDGIPILVNLLVNPPSEDIQVEVAISLGFVVLSNSENQAILSEESQFKFSMLLELLVSKKEHIRLRAGMALAVFAFNNTPQQYAIREAGGIKFSCFKGFLDSNNEYNKCYAAFQMVVLARVIVDVDQVQLTADGVTTLVNIIQSPDNNAVILSASLMASLAHTRAGIPDAMVTSGAIDFLLHQLFSTDDQVRSAVAVSLGYLSYNRTAHRLLLVACRNQPGLYDQMMNNIGQKPKISPEFVDDFKRAKIVGLPSQSLEINGGPPAVPRSREGLRPHTTVSGRRRNNSPTSVSRAKSAPAMVHQSRAKSAGMLRGKTPPSKNVMIGGKTVKTLPTPEGGALKTSVSAWK